MAWYWVIGLIIVIGLIYKLISAKPRSVAVSIGSKINIKPYLIESMITAMGPQRGLMFVEHMYRGGDDFIDIGVYTFIVYRISINDHENNIKWWKDRLRNSGFDPQMNITKAESAFTYLKDAGADISQMQNFINVYNSID